jgi:hypothetical protein
MWRRGWPIAAFAGVMSESFWWLGPVCDVALIVAYSFSQLYTECLQGSWHMQLMLSRSLMMDGLGLQLLFFFYAYTDTTCILTNPRKIHAMFLSVSRNLLAVGQHRVRAQASDVGSLAFAARSTKVIWNAVVFVCEEQSCQSTAEDSVI